MGVGNAVVGFPPRRTLFERINQAGIREWNGHIVTLILYFKAIYIHLTPLSEIGPHPFTASSPSPKREGLQVCREVELHPSPIISLILPL